MARFSSIIRWLWPASWVKKLALLAAIFFLASSGGFIAVSEQTSFCNSCHIMNPYYASWQQSKHSQVNCLECHVKPGFRGIVRAKLNGLAQAVDCFLDRTSPKPNALVEDASCLREGCHLRESLSSESAAEPNRPYKFSHQKHVFSELVGIHLLCTTCHSHFEGQEHFKVSTPSCLICHLQKAGTTTGRLMQTRCVDCHDVPAEVFTRGSARIDHRKFADSQLSCEGLCHDRQMVPQVSVRDVRCLDCHEFRNTGNYAATDLHVMHNGKDKVECLACHEMIDHTANPIGKHHTSLPCELCHPVPFQASALAEIESINLPADCSLCHNDPHSGQFKKACQECHSEHGWASRWIIDAHGPGAAFPLAGAHKGLECSRCHAGPKLAEARFAGLPKTCEQCHPDPHEGQMSMACDKCHDEQGPEAPWVKDHHRDQSAFALKARHAALECRQCHNQQRKAEELARMGVRLIAGNCRNCHQDPHQGQMRAPCSACHSESGWTGSDLLFLHERQASFKLEGPHAALACDACHGQDEKRYRPLPHECGNCHSAQKLAMQGITEGQKGAADAHEGRVSCTDCHDAGNAAQSLDQFAQKCAGCHNSHYGELLMAWAGSLTKNRLRAEQKLKLIPDSTDQRRAQIEQMIAEARQIGIHNVRLARQAYGELLQQASKTTTNAP